MLIFLLSIIGLVAFLTGLILVLKWHVKTPVSRQTEVLLTCAFLGLALGAWWYVTKGDRVEDRILSPLILASPKEVFLQFPQLHWHQALVQNAIVSFTRVFLGFSFAALLAVPLGLYMASFSNIAAFFRPLSLVGSYVPIVVFIPLTLAWFGMSEMQKVVFLFIGCFVVLLPLVVKTVSDVPSAFLDVAKTKGATQWQLVIPGVVSHCPSRHLGPPARRLWSGLGLDHFGRGGECRKGIGVSDFPIGTPGTY